MQPKFCVAKTLHIYNRPFLKHPCLKFHFNSFSDVAQPAAVAGVPGGARRGGGGGERAGRARGQPQGHPRPLLPAVEVQAAAEAAPDAATTGEQCE